MPSVPRTRHSCLQPGYLRQTCAILFIVQQTTLYKCSIVQMYYMYTTTVCIWKAFSIVTADWRYCCTANTKMHDIVWLLVHSMNVLLSPASRVQITISFNFKTSCAVQTLLCSVHGVLCSVQLFSDHDQTSLINISKGQTLCDRKIHQCCFIAHGACNHHGGSGWRGRGVVGSFKQASGTVLKIP